MYTIWWQHIRLAERLGFEVALLDDPEASMIGFVATKPATDE